VLIIDDSALMRQVLTQILETDPRLEVVGTAADPLIARTKIKELNPDVLTLDLEMPRMDGLTFLRNLMKLRPMPVVIVSSFAEANADVTLEALALGAIDFITKPKLDIAQELRELAGPLCEMVVTAAGVDRSIWSFEDCPDTDSEAPTLSDFSVNGGMVVGIGASTGGTEAIAHILSRLPADFLPILVAQHLPHSFLPAFARRLQRDSPFEVRLSHDGEPLKRGRVYLPSGDTHITVSNHTTGPIIRLDHQDRVDGHRPSVNLLFETLAASLGSRAVGMILTGMGDDGCRGLESLRAAGGFVFAQDQASSAIWGMPGEAVRRGLVDKVYPLHRLAGALMAQVSLQGNNS
jgi:two-component system, chemotaxis family, protein-glutamate methylesterase/glutaminase